MGREERWSGVWRSGVGGVDGRLVWGAPAPVPAAVAALLPDAGVVFGLVAGVAEVGEHVGPKALVLGGHEAGQVVAGLDLQSDPSQQLDCACVAQALHLRPQPLSNDDNINTTSLCLLSTCCIPDVLCDCPLMLAPVLPSFLQRKKEGLRKVKLLARSHAAHEPEKQTHEGVCPSQVGWETPTGAENRGTTELRAHCGVQLPWAGKQAQ